MVTSILLENIVGAKKENTPSNGGVLGPWGNTPRDTKNLTGDGRNVAFTTDNRANIHGLDAAWTAGDGASSVCHSPPRCPSSYTG